MVGQERDDDRLSTWSALVGGLAHELKNPLSTLNINLQLLREDWGEESGPLAARSIRKIDVMLQESKRLEGMLADFLRLTSPTPLDPQSSDLNELLSKVLDFMDEEFDNRKVDVNVQLDHAVGLVELDENLMRQVVINLMKNALDAIGEEGGSIHLHTSGGEDEVEVAIIDTGVGMDEETLERCFGFYFSTKSEGTGLGLPMVRRIVERHGGSIEAQSAPGHGTRFTIRLPRAGGAS